MKPERLYAIIFDAVYGSSALSFLLFTLDYSYNNYNWWRGNLANLQLLANFAKRLKVYRLFSYS